MNRKAKTAAVHVLGWALFCLLVAAFVRGFGRPFSHFWAAPFLLFVAVYALLFYLNDGLLLPRLYLRRKYAAYFTVFLLLLAAVYFFKPFERLVLQGNNQPLQQLPLDDPPVPREGGRRPPPLPPRQNGRPPQDVDIVSIILFFGVWAVSSVQQILRQWRLSERRAAQAEAEKIAAELAALKAQINPHFLFNTLNNIYSLAIVKSEHTADAILKLSSILRYLTDDVRHDFVALKSEVDCAANYIDLQKLRLSKKVRVDFTVEGETEGKQIAPLLLMTFIENAFKYGISNHEECRISIQIQAATESIHFFCQNHIFQRTAQEEREGIGISNAKRRLAYLYPEKFLLQIDTQNNRFTVDLTVTA